MDRGSPLQVLETILSSKENVDIYNYLSYTKEKIENYLERFFYSIVLDDKLFPKEEQLKILHTIREKLKELEIYLKYPWLHGKVKVTFAGRFSSGKSSIINTLLSEDILPRGVAPTTSIPTYISSAPLLEHSAYVILYNKKIVPTDLNQLKELNHKSLSGFASILQHVIDHIFFNYNHPLLNNITIIDTPGYDPGKGDIDRSLAFEVVKRCDVIFWTVDAGDGGISKESLQILKSINLNDKDLYIIVNKIDKKPPSARNNIAKHIEKTLKREGVKYKDILLFSSKEEKEKYRRTLEEILFRDISELSYNKSNNKVEEFMEWIHYLLNRVYYKIVDKQKEYNKIILEKENEAENIKNYMEKRIDSILEYDTLAQYFTYEVPWFGDNYYKIYEKDWEKFWRKLSYTFEQYSEIIITEGWKIFEAEKEIESLKKEISEYDKLLEECRKAIKEYDKLKLDILKTLGYDREVEEDETILGALKKVFRGIFRI